MPGARSQGRLPPLWTRSLCFHFGSPDSGEQGVPESPYMGAKTVFPLMSYLPLYFPCRVPRDKKAHTGCPGQLETL